MCFSFLEKEREREREEPREEKEMEQLAIVRINVICYTI